MNSKIILVTFMCLAILIYNPFVAIIGFSFFFCCYWILYKFLKKKLNQSGEVLSKEQELRFKLMSEGFGGIKDLLLTKRQNFFFTIFEKSSDKYAYHTGYIQVLSLVPKYILEFLAFSIVILLAVYLLKFSDVDLSSNDILPTLSIYGFAGYKMLPAFQQIYYSLSSIKGSISAFENVKEDLFESLKKVEYETKNNNLSSNLNNNTNNAPQISKSFLIFKDVSFYYQTSDNQSV